MSLISIYVYNKNRSNKTSLEHNNDFGIEVLGAGKYTTCTV
jgi:hypothetical protein